MSKKKKRKVWICRDGTRIPIKKMGSDHLLNAIRFFARLGKEDNEKIIWLKKEAVIRELDFEGKEKFCNIKVDEPIENRFEILDL